MPFTTFPIPGAATWPIAGRTTPVEPSSAAPSALAMTTPSAEDEVAAAPWCSNTVATVVAASAA